MALTLNRNSPHPDGTSAIKFGGGGSIPSALGFLAITPSSPSYPRDHHFTLPSTASRTPSPNPYYAFDTQSLSSSSSSSMLNSSPIYDEFRFAGTGSFSFGEPDSYRDPNEIGSGIGPSGGHGETVALGSLNTQLSPAGSNIQLRSPLSAIGSSLSLPPIPESSTTPSTDDDNASVVPHFPYLSDLSDSMQEDSPIGPDRKDSMPIASGSGSGMGGGAASGSSASSGPGVTLRARSQTMPSVKSGRAGLQGAGQAGGSGSAGGATGSASGIGAGAAKMSPKSPKTPALPGTGKPPSQCRFCEMSFKKLEHCQRHERTHTLDRPYPCKVCGKAFARQDTLNRHARLHDRKDEPPVGSSTSPNAFGEIALPGHEPSSGKARGRRRVKSVSDSVGPSPMLPRSGGSPHLPYPSTLAGSQMAMPEWSGSGRRLSEGGAVPGLTPTTPAPGLGPSFTYAGDERRLVFDGPTNALGLANHASHRHMNMPVIPPSMPSLPYDHERLSPANSDSTAPHSDAGGDSGVATQAIDLGLNHFGQPAYGGEPRSEQQQLHPHQMTHQMDAFSPRGGIIRDLHGLAIRTPPSGSMVPVPLPYPGALAPNGQIDNVVTFSPSSGQPSFMPTPLGQVPVLHGTPGARFLPELDGYHESEPDVDSNNDSFRLGSVSSSISFTPPSTINDMPSSAELANGPVPAGAVGMGPFSPSHNVPSLSMATVPEEGVAPAPSINMTMYDFMGRSGSAGQSALGIDVASWQDAMLSAGVSPAQTISSLPPDDIVPPKSAGPRSRMSMPSLNYISRQPQSDANGAHVHRAAMQMPVQNDGPVTAQDWSRRIAQQQAASAAKSVRASNSQPNLNRNSSQNPNPNSNGHGRPYIPHISTRSLQPQPQNGSSEHSRHMLMPVSAPPHEVASYHDPSGYQHLRSRSMSMDGGSGSSASSGVSLGLGSGGMTMDDSQMQAHQTFGPAGGWFPAVPTHPHEMHSHSHPNSNRSSSGFGLGLVFDGNVGVGDEHGV